MVTAAAPRLGKSERTCRAILAAAEAQFARRGFHRARLDDIGAQAGVAGPAILYHFDGKQALYHAVLDRLLDGLLEAIEAGIDRATSLSDRLEGLVTSAVRYVAARPALAHLVLQEAGTDDPELRAELQQRAEPFLSLLVGLYEEGERAGVLRPVSASPLQLLSAIGGTVVFYFGALPTFIRDLPADYPGPEDLEALERGVLTIARQLLGIPGVRSPRRNLGGRKLTKEKRR
jgi:AcrR family transcriptional regulator